LPSDFASGDDAWTWLPLTPQQALIFGWGSYLGQPEAFLAADEPDSPRAGYVGNTDGYPVQLPDGVLSRVRFPVSDGSVIRTEWRISARWRQKNPLPQFHAALLRAIDFFWKHPRMTLPLTHAAQALLLGATTKFPLRDISPKVMILYR